MIPCLCDTCRYATVSLKVSLSFRCNTDREYLLSLSLTCVRASNQRSEKEDLSCIICFTRSQAVRLVNLCAAIRSRRAYISYDGLGRVHYARVVLEGEDIIIVNNGTLRPHRGTISLASQDHAGTVVSKFPQPVRLQTAVREPRTTSRQPANVLSMFTPYLGLPRIGHHTWSRDTGYTRSRRTRSGCARGPA
jgi:hypothetical protein